MSSTLTENAIKILEKRYLNNGESVDSMWDRVSGGNPRFRQLMAELKFLPNSPTLFNMGLNNGCTSSACFVFDVDDEMGALPTDNPRSIVNTRAKAIGVAKAGGGVGYYFGNLRPKNSPIKSIHRKACGPVIVLRDYHNISHLITQGGKRELAQMGVLPAEHADIREFIHCKDKDPQGLGSFNISVSWSNESVFKALNDYTDSGDYFRDLWAEQVHSAWKHGCPGMLFPDVINGQRGNPNPHLGRINAVNPCGETPNRSDEPCNLGSLALPRFFSPGNRSVNWDALGDAVVTATEFLDDILDRNVFPHPAITKAALLTRKLGLGVMGWADLLAMMHVPYDSDEAVELAGRVSSFISDLAIDTSERMAREKGPYEGFSDQTLQPRPRRNETNTSVAPTGTIALIAGLRGWSIEPWFADTNERTTAEGMVLVEKVPDWIRKHLDGFVPKTAGEIGWEWHVRHQAAWQANVDLGVSKTINLPHEATVDDVSGAYRMMYETGCKGGTIYRDGCRDEQVLVTEKTKSVFLLAQGAGLTTGKKPMPTERKSRTIKFKVDGMNLFLTAGLYDDGSVGEIFVMGDFGSTIGGLLDAFCITFSVALQNGVPLRELIEHHRNKRFEPSGITNNPDVPICTSICDLIVHWLERKFLAPPPTQEPVDVILRKSGMVCPECGRVAVYKSNCLACPDESCGWSKCG